MTETIVLDASGGVPLVWVEDISPLARDRVARWVAEGAALVVPASFWTEVVNVLTKRHHQSGAAVIEALYELDQLPMTTIGLDRPLLLAGLDLVERSGLTIHDAIYLALARSTGARLATFDGDLIRAGGPDVIDMWQGDLGQPGGHRLGEDPVPYDRAERPVTWPTWPGAGSYLATLRKQAIASR